MGDALDPVELARAWAAQDPDEVTRAQLEALLARVDAGDPDARAEVGTRFAGRLTFGTAGLRGELGAGPLRMNRVLVGQAAAGLAAYLLAREPRPSVVIGYDGRRNSEIFARDTAEIMQGAGVRAILLPRLLPTPVLAFAVRHLDVSAGVMVTASHNPAADNGYKVYLGGLDHGSQIVPPADAEIQAEIVRVASGSIADLPRSTDYETAGEEVVDEYVRRTAAIAGEARPRTLRFVYTAMHGVGWQTASRVFSEAGFTEVTSVPEQQEPDAAFPTVDFPNPEEPGALDLAFATADRAGVDLVIANDPDADRLAVGIRTDSGWRMLTGNEVGYLLGWRIAERLQREGRDGTFACSVASSPALSRIAQKYGLDFAETLTGLKWISRVGGLAYGYEEALGYLVNPQTLRDKDGISAAVEVLTMCDELAADGHDLDDRIDEFALRFGAYASSQVAIRVADLSRIAELTAMLRDAPPERIGSVRVERIDDFSEGFGALPPSDMLRIQVDGGRVIIRPSGTEPKLKAYIDAWSDEGDARQRREAAAARVAELEDGIRQILGVTR